VRAATNGATYTCPGAAVFSPDIEFQILRPSITVPGAERVFRIAFDNCGYECKVSDKGAYAPSSIDKFGGLEIIAQALRHQKTSAQFHDTKAPGDDVHDDGDYLRDKRRYLNFACISKIPSWYYKLDEIVYQMLSHDGDVPVLALDAMRSRSQDSLTPH
jgi:hypothetical protein